MDDTFTRCDNHRRGPHLSRALFVSNYFDHDAKLVMCTHRGKKGKVCGNVYMVPGRNPTLMMCVWCGGYGTDVEEYRIGGTDTFLHPEHYAEVIQYRHGRTEAEQFREASDGQV